MPLYIQPMLITVPGILDLNGGQTSTENPEGVAEDPAGRRSADRLPRSLERGAGAPTCATAPTVGVGTIMDAKEVIILVTGHNKARALHHAIEQGVNHMWTVSCLQLHHADHGSALPSSCATKTPPTSSKSAPCGTSATSKAATSTTGCRGLRKGKRGTTPLGWYAVPPQPPYGVPPRNAPVRRAPATLTPPKQFRKIPAVF